jgi:hypothetical protein
VSCGEGVSRLLLLCTLTAIACGYVSVLDYLLAVVIKHFCCMYDVPFRFHRLRDILDKSTPRTGTSGSRLFLSCVDLARSHFLPLHRRWLLAFCSLLSLLRFVDSVDFNFTFSL